MTDLRTDLERLRADAAARVASVPDADALAELRHELFGRSGSLTLLLKQLGSVPAEERPAVGQLANEVRGELEAAIEARQSALSGTEDEARLAEEALDMSAPGRPMPIGHLHPVMTLMRDLREIFHAYGFEVFEGPEIETDEYNFELLNIPPDHPVARPVGHALRRGPRERRGRGAAAGRGRHDPAHAHLADPDPRHARPRAADPRPHARADASATRRSTRATASSSSRSRGWSSIATRASPTSRASWRRSPARCTGGTSAPASGPATTRSPSRARRSTSAASSAAARAARPASGPAG